MADLETFPEGKKKCRSTVWLLRLEHGASAQCENTIRLVTILQLKVLGKLLLPTPA